MDIGNTDDFAIYVLAQTFVCLDYFRKRIYAGTSARESHDVETS